jgi:hypothetical protein
VLYLGTVTVTSQLLKRHQTSNRGRKAAEAAHPCKRKGDLLLPCKTIKHCTRLSQENPELGKGLGKAATNLRCIFTC